MSSSHHLTVSPSPYLTVSSSDRLIVSSSHHLTVSSCHRPSLTLNVELGNHSSFEDENIMDAARERQAPNKLLSRKAYGLVHVRRKTSVGYYTKDGALAGYNRQTGYLIKEKPHPRYHMSEELEVMDIETWDVEDKLYMRELMNNPSNLQDASYSEVNHSILGSTSKSLGI